MAVGGPLSENRAVFGSQNPTKDLLAGVVVFLVALPLCLGIALASGAPLFSGIIAGVVGGMVLTLVSRSALGVSGPAAGLTVIVLGAIETLGFDAFLLAVVLAGGIQLAAGFLRAGVIGYYFPSSVIKGMLAGIGLILILKQLPYALGHAGSYEGDLAFSEAGGSNSFISIAWASTHIHPGALFITLASMALLLLWERPFIKANRLLGILPGPLIAVVFGLVLNQLLATFAPVWELLPSQLVSLPTPENASEWLGLFTLPDFTAIGSPDVWVAAMTLAVIASIETLLSVDAVDKLDPERRRTPVDLELKAQGVGNLVSGMIGGLPVTQVIVRSAANVQAGGQTRLSAFFHGGLLAASVALFPSLINQIPLACLAAILLVTGYKLARISIFREMYSLGIQQFAPFVVTVLGLVFTDMITGIALGMAFAFVHILWIHYQVDFMTESIEGDQVRITLGDHMSFLNKASVRRELYDIPKGSHVTIDGSQCHLVDHDVREVLTEYLEYAGQHGIEVVLDNVDGVEMLGSKRPIERAATGEAAAATA